MGFKKVAKKVSEARIANTEKIDDLKVNGSNVILKGVEIKFWSYRKVSSNSQYEPKFCITVKLSDKHVKLMEAAKEAAIMWYCNENGIDQADIPEFSDSIYTGKDGEVTYTFRSSKDFRELTEVDGEPCDPELKIGKGSIANIAIRASATKIYKSYTVIFYLNGVNIKTLEEFKGSQFNLHDALR